MGLIFMIEIRKATYDDIDTMQAIFKHARSEMEKNGNPTQWSNNRPPLFLIEKDLNNNTSYLILNDGIPVATFSYTIGIEPTYVEIYHGKWLNDKPYGTIHRIASLNTVPGIFKIVLDFVTQFGVDIRIDTHQDNKIMLHLFEKYGFTYCGIIIIDDGTTRLAFQKIVE